MEEKEIISKVLEGDAEPYAVLIRKYHTQILNLCYQILPIKSEAEDAAQDVFIKAYKKLGSFRKEAHFSTWVYRIAYNHCLDLIRANARRKSDSLESLYEERGDKLESNLISRSSGPIAMEDRQLIENALSRLSPEYRMVLVLREGQGMTYEEIAKTLGISLGSVRARLRRARSALQKNARHISSADGVLAYGGTQ